jgi:hypothetical protein
MKADVIERSAAVLLGMAAGYGLWLAGVTALTVIIPMQHIIAAAAIFLGLLTITAFAFAVRFKRSDRRSLALVFWWAPILPVIAGIYSLIVFLN